MADRFATRLAREVETWVRDGLITAPQASRIVARYPASAAWFTRPIALFSLIGGALIAAGVALVIAHNWAEIHRWAKLVALAALMLGTHGGGLTLRGRGRGALGDGLLLLGGALLLIGIALVGQIYHLSGRPSDAVLVWWVFLLPAGYALPSPALAGLAWAGAGAWFLMALADRATLLGAAVGERWPLVAVAVSAFGLLFFALGILHGERTYRRLGRFLEPLGLLGLIGGLVALGAVWRGTSYAVSRYATAGEPGVFVALLLLAAAAVVLAARRLPREAPAVRGGFVVLLLLVILFLAVFQSATIAADVVPHLPALAFTSWTLLFVLSLALIVTGARWGRTGWINLGLAAILVQAIWRYVDLLGTMLETSALFLSTGVFVLLLGALLERWRRRMTREARARQAEA